VNFTVIAIQRARHFGHPRRSPRWRIVAPLLALAPCSPRAPQAESWSNRMYSHNGSGKAAVLDAPGFAAGAPPTWRSLLEKTNFSSRYCKASIAVLPRSGRMAGRKIPSLLDDCRKNYLRYIWASEALNAPAA